MPENNSSAAKPEPGTSSGEFDFAVSTAKNPRLKRRSLKVVDAKSKPAEPAIPDDIAQEAPPHSGQLPPDQTVPSDKKIEEIQMTEPDAIRSARPLYRSTTTPQNSSTAPPASGTLYYSSPSRKDQKVSSEGKAAPAQEVLPPPASSEPMKITSLPTSTAPSSTARPISAVRPATASDYRSNIERQAREQKSVGHVLSIIVYVLIGFFVLGASLAGYGTYVLSKQIHQQSVTMTDLDNRYAAQNQALTAQLKNATDTLTQQQAQAGRMQEVILHQQDSINKLMASDAATSAALRQERQARADETAGLRTRIRSLEIRQPPRP